MTFILGTGFFAQVPPAHAERGYHVYRHLQVQSKLYKQLGRTTRAAEALIEAYEHYPDEKTLLDAVELLAEAVEDERALRLVERYLTLTRSPSGHLKGKKLLVMLRKRLSEHSAEIELSAEPGNSKMCFDVEGTDCLQLPALKWIKADAHEFRFQYPGLATQVYPITINPGKHLKIRATLKKRVPRGRLDIFARNPQAEVVVDGNPEGRVPIMGLVVPAGEHVVHVNLGNNEHWRGKVIVHEARTTTVFAGRAPPTAPVKVGQGLKLQPSMAPAPPVIVKRRNVRLPRVSAFKMPPKTVLKASPSQKAAPPTPPKAVAQVSNAPEIVNLPVPVVTAIPDIKDTSESINPAKRPPPSKAIPKPKNTDAPIDEQLPEPVIIPETVDEPAPKKGPSKKVVVVPTSVPDAPDVSLPDLPDSPDNGVDVIPELPNSPDGGQVEVPDTASEPDVVTEAPNEPNLEPEPSNEPDFEPETSNEPDFEPETSNEPDFEPEPSNEPDFEPEPSNEPDFEPEPSNEPDFEPAAANEPDFEPAAANEPDFEPDDKDSDTVREDTDTEEPAPADESDDEVPEQVNADNSEDDADNITGPDVAISTGGGGGSWMKTTGWTTLSLGMATLGGAITTSLLSSANANDANKLDPGLPDYDKKFDNLKEKTESQALLSNIMYPMGGALAVTGIVLLILDNRSGVKVSKKDSVELEADVDVNKVMLRTTLRF